MNLINKMIYGLGCITLVIVIAAVLFNWYCSAYHCFA